jgi:seryl-tRNA synthetase
MSDIEAAQRAYQAELIEHGILIPSGVPGLYGKSAAFEKVVAGIDQIVARYAREDGAESFCFPPLIPRTQFEKTDYLNSMPQLPGAILSFQGDAAAHRVLLDRLHKGEDWTESLERTEVVLTPAACYPVYPMAAKRGPLKPGGLIIDVASYCFRHEPSPDPARMQMFRMHENVRLSGSVEEVLSWRETWIKRGVGVMSALGLEGVTDVANDPFFGRGGKMLAINQVAQKLKFEFLYPITSTEKPTALISFNYHQDHFGHLYGIQAPDGSPAHTACFGFGLERITLALFKTHGFDPGKWPSAVSRTLWP